MKARIEVELSFDQDVLKTLRENGKNVDSELKEELKERLFHVSEDWVIDGQEPEIIYECSKAGKHT